METKKPFKDTEAGKLLTQFVPEAAHAIGSVLPDAGAIGIAKNLLEKVPVSESFTQQQKDQVAQKLNELQLTLTDVASARDMQKEALKQNDIFSKRYLYIFAAVYVVLGFGYMFFINIYPIPTENQSLAYLAAGALVVSGIKDILGFLFGSSMGSKDKTQALINATTSKAN